MIGSKVWLIAAVAVAGLRRVRAQRARQSRRSASSTSLGSSSSRRNSQAVAEKARGRVRPAAARSRGDAAAAAHPAGDVPARCARHGRRGAARISSGRFATGSASCKRTRERVPRGSESAAQRRARQAAARGAAEGARVRARAEVRSCCSPTRASSSPARRSTSRRPCSRVLKPRRLASRPVTPRRGRAVARWPRP